MIFKCLISHTHIEETESQLILMRFFLQALDEEYLKADAQFGGVDQRKIFTFAEKVSVLLPISFLLSLRGMQLKFIEYVAPTSHNHIVWQVLFSLFGR